MYIMRSVKITLRAGAACYRKMLRYSDGAAAFPATTLHYYREMPSAASKMRVLAFRRSRTCGVIPRIGAPKWRRNRRLSLSRGNGRGWCWENSLRSIEARAHQSAILIMPRGKKKLAARYALAERVSIKYQARSFCGSSACVRRAPAYKSAQLA